MLKLSSAGCAAFTVGSPSPYDETLDLSSPLPALCTNSAPLTRSNVTSYDTTRQIDVLTPKAGILRGFRDKFTWRFLSIKYTESTAGQGRFQLPKPLNVPSNAVRTALTYGPFCAQVRLVHRVFRPSRNVFIAPRRRQWTCVAHRRRLSNLEYLFSHHCGWVLSGYCPKTPCHVLP